MNASHPSLAPQAADRKLLVWDAPVRLFHLLMIASFALAWITAESDAWLALHIASGTTMAVLVAFRLVWGLVGTRHARFVNFVRGPREALGYLGSLLRGRPEHHTGHNPAAAWAILALLALTALVVGSGWALIGGLGGHFVEEAHEVLAAAMLALVGVHVLGVLVHSLVHRENIVAAMIDGRKRGAPDQGIRRAWTLVAVLMLAALVALWTTQWQTLAAGPAASAAVEGHGRHGDDDDD